MLLPTSILLTAGAAALSLACARRWHTAVLLGLIEAGWVCLCGAYGALLVETGDLFFLFWACVMLFFSAVELIISATLFIYSATTASQSAPSGVLPTQPLTRAL